jgi:hypothetical protein
MKRYLIITLNYFLIKLFAIVQDRVLKSSHIVTTSAKKGPPKSVPFL